jgi:hypothetical protein
MVRFARWPKKTLNTSIVKSGWMSAHAAPIAVCVANFHLAPRQNYAQLAILPERAELQTQEPFEGWSTRTCVVEVVTCDTSVNHASESVL